MSGMGARIPLVIARIPLIRTLTKKIVTAHGKSAPL
jgi:hypothetical protein